MLYPKTLSLEKSPSKQSFVASIKVVLRKKKNAKGHFPIAIRITKNRKSSFLLTGQFIDEKFWDQKNQKVRKSHPNAPWLNNYIIKKLAEATDKLLELEGNNEGVTSQFISHDIKKKNKSSSFFDLAKIL